MNNTYEQLQMAVKTIRETTAMIPEVGIVLGSGLGEFANCVKVEATVPYSKLEGFPVSTVPGHDGSFIFGYVDEKPVVLMKGRTHYYEGYDMEKVVLPIRLMGILGIKKLILTNAAGCVNTDFAPGDLMMITDHISAFVPSPLRGPNIDEFGPRFPDMSSVYSKNLQKVICDAAEKQKITLRKGIYLQWKGPQYESPAEIRMFRTLGADAVGMSTVCEAVAARHMGLEIAGISCITNMAAGILDQPLSHEEVQAVATQVKDKFEKLILEIVRNL